MATKRVLSVGQCFADHSAISRTLQNRFSAEVVPASTREEALSQLRQGGFDLVLVNRVFDADGSAGLDVIRQLKAADQWNDVPVMLVSNFEDSQRAAIALGAVPGFGKAALGQPQTIARLNAVLGEEV